jgi:hypothetical protein
VYYPKWTLKNKWRGACGSRSWSFFSVEWRYIPLTGGRSAKEPLALQSSLWSVTGVFQNLARLSSTGGISAYSRTNEKEACEKIISQNPRRFLNLHLKKLVQKIFLLPKIYFLGLRQILLFIFFFAVHLDLESFFFVISLSADCQPYFLSLA